MNLATSNARVFTNFDDLEKYGSINPDKIYSLVGAEFSSTIGSCVQDGRHTLELRRSGR